LAIEQWILTLLWTDRIVVPGFWGHVIQAISKKLVDQYQQNGVVCLRGVFADWIPALCKGADMNVESASNRVLIHGDGKTGRFLEDFCNWQRIPEYRDFVLNSNIGEIAAALMQSRCVQFFHDHYLQKDAGAATARPGIRICPTTAYAVSKQ